MIEKGTTNRTVCAVFRKNWLMFISASFKLTVNFEPVLRFHGDKPRKPVFSVRYNGNFKIFLVSFSLFDGLIDVQVFNPLNFLMDSRKPNDIACVSRIPAILGRAAAIIALLSAICRPFQLSPRFPFCLLFISASSSAFLADSAYIPLTVPLSGFRLLHPIPGFCQSSARKKSA